MVARGEGSGMDNGWTESAEAWIADMGEHGDFTRRFVLDPAMTGRVAGRGFATALDVGCGEGRFCRALRGQGIRPVGLDPTEALLRRARELDPEGDYREGRAEHLPFDSGAFDLVVSYLSLIDIPDLDAAAAEMARVLRPGGTLLIANLASFATAAGERAHWVRDDAGRPLHFPVDRYLEERAYWADWRGIRIHTWHRPLGRYTAAFLAQGLVLSVFAEPEPVAGADPDKAEQYRRAPYCYVMEWRKPG
jgi:SAM-dependent methyltransferase